MAQKSGNSKLFIVIGVVAGAIVLLGIGAFAIFQMFISTPKNSYLLAEQGEIEHVFEQFEDRFEEELEWYDHMQSNAVESSFNITAETNDPSMGEFGAGQMINSSEINLNAGADMENEIATLELDADVASFNIEGVHGFINGETLGVTLPFIEEHLTVDEADATGMLQQMDSNTFTGGKDIDYSMFFEEQGFSESQRQYLEDEYLSFIREELPDDAFESDSEDITVGENSVNADKYTLSLTQEQIQTFLRDLLNKMAEDEELYSIFEAQIMASNLGAVPQEELDTLSGDFSEGLSEMAEEVSNTEFPDGLTSIIWLDGDTVIQRDFHTSFMVDGEQTAVSLNGTNEVTDESEFWNYDIMFSDSYEDIGLNLTVDLNEVESGYEDTVTFSPSDTGEELVISSHKVTEDDNQNLNLQLDMPTGSEGETVSLFYESEGTYESDQMNLNHSFYADDGMTVSRDTFVLNVAQDSATVSEITEPDVSDTVNIGQMSEAELDDYLMNDLGPQFEEWIQEMQPGFQ